jgi:hypothetical protein
MKYSKGIMWLDDCRIPFVDEKVPRLNVSYEHKTNNNFGGGNDKRHGTSTQSISEGQGRFTPNLLVCDDMLNDGNIGGGGKHSGVIKRKRRGYKLNPNSDNLHSTSPDNYGDKGTNSRYYDLDKWFEKVIECL